MIRDTFSVLRLAARALRLRPALTLSVAIPLSLAVAAAGSLFAVVDGLMFRPLPFERPEELIVIRFPQVNGRLPALAYEPERARERGALRLRLERELAAATQIEPSFDFDAGVRRALGLEVTAVDSRFFETFGLKPILGRGFAVGDESHAAGAARDLPMPIVIGHDVWRRHFGARDDVLAVHDFAGRRVQVLGVLAPGVKFPNDTNIWVPRVQSGRPPSHGRLRTGTTLEELAARFPELEFTQLADAIRPADTAGVLLLFGGASILLAVAWFQAGALTLSGGIRRASEFGARLALGANRRHLRSHLAAENGLLAMLVLAGALLMLHPLASAIIDVLPDELTRGQYLTPDVRAFLFAGCATVLGFSLLTIWPAEVIYRSEPLQLLNGHVTGLPGRTEQVHYLLMAGQVALTTALVYVTGLLGYSYVRAATFNYGFDTERVLVFTPPLPEAVTPSAQMFEARGSDEVFDARYADKLNRIVLSLDRLEATPGIRAAASFFKAPLISDRKHEEEITSYDGRVLVPGVAARVNTVSPRCDEALGATLLAGQSFDDPEYRGNEAVAVVNETLADRLAPSVNIAGAEFRVDVIGRSIRTNSFRGRIIGVIRDLVDTSPMTPPDPQFFVPTYRGAAGAMILIRTAEPADQALPAVLMTLTDIWGSLSARQFQLMVDAWREALKPFLAQAVLLSVIAGSCLPLVVIGVAAACLHSMRLRAKELALRVALGADPRDLRWFAMRHTISASTWGLACGLILGFGIGRLIASQLFEVRFLDLPTTLAAALLLMGVAAAAAYVLAIKACRTDPALALREG